MGGLIQCCKWGKDIKVEIYIQRILRERFSGHTFKITRVGKSGRWQTNLDVYAYGYRNNGSVRRCKTINTSAIFYFMAKIDDKGQEVDGQTFKWFLH